MKNSFNLFGFKINTKKFILTMLISLIVVLVLVGAEMLIEDFSISWYGLIIGVAFILAVLISSELSKERGLDKEMPYNVIWLVFPLAIIGARIFYVVNSLHEFTNYAGQFNWLEAIGIVSTNPFVFNMQGLSIYGGIIGGVIGVLIYCYAKKINVLKAFDVFAPVLILGQSIGRWGNFVNQEVFGFEITASWLQWFPFGVNVGGTWYLATFFYESVLNLAGFFVLLYLIRKTKKPGTVAFIYFIYYGIVRLILESLRVAEYILLIPGTNIQFSSLFSVLFILIGVAGLLFINFKKTTS